MLQNTAILKVGGGLAAIGSTAGAGYYAHTQGLFTQTETSENTTAKDYLIVRSTTHTSTADGEIYNYALFSSPKKNFQCVTTVTAEIIDEDCEIYKLSDEEKRLAKAISNNVGANSKNIKENNNYFKITSKKLIDAITKWESTTDQLIQITQTDKNKVFAKLTPVYRVKNGEIVARKTSFLYAKVNSAGASVTQPSTEIDDANKNYQCQLVTDKFDCSIIELTLETTKKTIKQPANNTPAKKDKLKVADTHFRIEMEEKYLNKFDFSNNSQTIDVIAKAGSNANEKYSTLTPLFHRIDKEISVKDSFWLSVSTSETISDASKTGYNKCKIADAITQINCEIYKFSSDYDSNAEIDFSGAITKTDDIKDVKKDKFFVIKFENNVANINNLTPETKIALGTAIASDKEHVFTVKKRLFIDPSATNGSLTAKTVHLLDI